MNKRKKTQQYISEFKKAREDWKQKEREKMEEENRKIMAFASLQKQRESEQNAQKKEREEAMGRVQKAVHSRL